MKVQLEAFHKRAKKKRVIISRDIVIGRGADCHLRIASSEVSREHCRLVVGENEVFIHDLGSSNGTILDGKKITANQDVSLATNSMLVIGPMKLVVRFDVPVDPNESDAGLAETVESSTENADAEETQSLTADQTEDTEFEFTPETPPDVKETVAESSSEPTTDTAPAEDEEIASEIESDEPEATELSGLEDSVDAGAETVQIEPGTLYLDTDTEEDSQESAVPTFDEAEVANNATTESDADEVALEEADSDAEAADEPVQEKGKLHSLFGMLSRKKKADTEEPNDEANEESASAEVEPEPILAEQKSVEVSATDSEGSSMEAHPAEETEDEYTEVEPEEEDEDVSDNEIMEYLGEPSEEDDQADAVQDGGLTDFLNQFEKN